MAYVDVTSGKIQGNLVALPGERGVAISAEGHYSGSRRAEQHLVYVAQGKHGSLTTYTPAEFERQFGFKNNPERVRLIGN